VTAVATERVDCAGPTKVVRVMGFRTDAAGFQGIGLIGFRAHCERCGYLGKVKPGYFAANSDRQIHRGQR
jgi:hypothetical protein